MPGVMVVVNRVGRGQTRLRPALGTACGAEQHRCRLFYTGPPPPPEQVTGDKTPPLLRSRPPLSSSSAPTIPVPSGRAHGLQSFNSLTTCLFSSWPPLFTDHSLAPEGGVCVFVKVGESGTWVPQALVLAPGQQPRLER